ncbi:hypothetical protein [Staphylococcus edaphicus]|uniref:Uncharacterized protein n=1 Tax=Staphylococcus edaphicus TaxID=1955013 RepID=A0A2C6WHI5_9STAP|nr:hypothetical protein [Staphylococcus edaphicus]PHK48580.1 hypothetical protein BTJ66_12925 [Staphylococcus edaphicus]UQW81445.1 hypothetical protein MNY58_12950 [Staphylococcus edaphicus]
MATFVLIFHLICLVLVLVASGVALKEFRKPTNRRNQQRVDALLVFVLVVALIAILSSVFTDL